MNNLRMKTVQNAISELDPHLEFFKGDGYFYMNYDDHEKNVFHTSIIMAYRLNFLTLEQYINAAKDFLEQIKSGKTNVTGTI